MLAKRPVRTLIQGCTRPHPVVCIPPLVGLDPFCHKIAVFGGFVRLFGPGAKQCAPPMEGWTSLPVVGTSSPPPHWFFGAWPKEVENHQKKGCKTPVFGGYVHSFGPNAKDYTKMWWEHTKMWWKSTKMWGFYLILAIWPQGQIAGNTPV